MDTRELEILENIKHNINPSQTGMDFHSEDIFISVCISYILLLHVCLSTKNTRHAKGKKNSENTKK
jgi:hypothetical protein